MTLELHDLIEERSEAGSEAGLGALHTAAGNLPLRELRVAARLRGLAATTSVRQTYVNPHGRPLEATYIFPLPDRAAVTSFRLRVGERTVEGELQERGAARREYDAAMASGHQAAIVEEERPDVFTLRAGNIPPRAAVTVELELLGPLAFADGEVTFRFPLVVAPRYVPGAPLDGEPVGDGVAPDTDAAPDASRVTPPVLLRGFPSPVRLAIEVEIDGAGLEPRALRSTLPGVVSGAGGASRLTVSPGARVDRDFVLRYCVAGERTNCALLVSDDATGGEGTFLLTLVPQTATAARRPRDVVFILDRSGSMAGWKMIAARRAIGRMIDTLGPQDRFSLYAFDDELCTPPGLDELGAATDRARFRAIEFLARLEARGGTELAAPLTRALDALGRGERDRDRRLVLITDGQVANEDQLLRCARKRARDIVVFTVGIDQAVNAGFLGRLAELGGGRCELVESEERLDEVMERLHRTIDTALVREISVELEGAELVAGSLTPDRPPDLFAAAPLVLSGRTRGDRGRPLTVCLRGARIDGGRWEERVTARRSDDPAAGRIWARSQLRQLEDRYVVLDDAAQRDELQRQIVAVSLRHHVLCRFTAFVAVDRGVRVATDPAALQRVLQPVEPPAGWAQKCDSTQHEVYARFADVDVDMRKQESKPLYDQRVARKARARTCTQAGVLRGKMTYLSPGAARGEPLTAADDVFLLGAVLYEMLTGRRLFQAASEFETLQRVISWDTSLLEPAAAELGVFLPLLRRALAASREERLPDAAAFLRELQEVVASARLADGASVLRALVSRHGRPAAAGPGGGTLGAFERLRRICFTGDGEIWEARLPGGERCALRCLLPELAADEEVLAAFLDEGSFGHPHVVEVLSTGIEAGVAYVAMELVDGPSLRELLRGGRLPVEVAAEIVAGAASGLAHLHGLGCVHRVLDPGKILIGSDGRVKLASPGPSPTVASREAGVEGEGSLWQRLRRLIGGAPRKESFWK